MEKDSGLLIEDILTQLIRRIREYRLNFSAMEESDFRKKIETLFRSVLKENRVSFTHHEQEKVLGEIMSYFLGLGPLEKLLNDPGISEILVNGPREVYIERDGNLEVTDITFKDEERLLYFIDKILSPLGRRVTELEPYIDARLKDGSRINIVRSPVSSVGPVLTIRKYSSNILNTDDLINLGTLDSRVADFFKACVISRINVLVSGGAGSGKTTLLNVLTSFILGEERIITIEDTRELRILRKHVVSLETRPPNIEGKGEITIRDLLKNSLHMRPDRIIVGEVRSSEVLDMIQAMNTGHDGSMTTLHANSPLEALERLEVLVLMGSPNISSEVAKRQIISGIKLVIHMKRFPDGSRKVTQISEVLKSKEYALEDIFVLEETADKTSKLKPTGRVPAFYPQLKTRANYMCKEFKEGE